MKLCKFDYNEVSFKVLASDNKCKCGFKIGEEINLRDMLPDKLCIHALHTFYPYFVTLGKGGWFEWVEYGGGVCVHCMNPVGIIVKIFKEKEGVRINIVNNPADCILGYAAGQGFEIKNSDKLVGIVTTAYPYILFGKQEFAYYCNKCDGTLVFSIMHKKAKGGGE